MAKVQMLICDDNPAISKSLAGYFEAEGMEVLCAASGEEALALYCPRGQGHDPRTYHQRCLGL